MDGNFLKKILKSSSNYSEEFTNKLILICEKLIPDIETHLKTISQTLPNFDVHDESHAENVLENMLTISNYHKEDSPKLTDIEYFLIIFSAYVHDSGMALPKWQLNIFKATEGDKRFDLYEDISLKMNNDGKKSFTFSDARQWIMDHRELIYRDYNTVEKFIFSELTEDKFVDSLAKSLISYQEFRNGYTPDLNSIDNKMEYLKKSEEIRYEYIRSNHHIFSAKNCELLVNKLESYCGKFNANKLCDDLSKIVIGHGLDFSEIKGYSLRSNYSKGNYANQFFITMLLRLGDIIHFSSDRSPESLLSSKLIQDPISLIHWKVKQEDINFWLNSFNEKGRRQISYSAYFKEPKLYYFFQDYL
ncbi:ATP-binding protein, partial [Enterococcus faecalis]|nr:ATP-binding protein [Enterococcus faecalis]